MEHTNGDGVARQSDIGILGLFWISPPTIKFAIMLVAQIAHAACPVEHGLIIHLHSRCPARHNELFFVLRGMVEVP